MIFASVKIFFDIKQEQAQCIPDKLAPATIPVTAGKKTANTEKKLCSDS